MPIARASGQGSGVVGNNVTSVSRAFPSNVATDSLVLVCLTHYNPPQTDLDAGPFKSAGTATLGTWQKHADRRVLLGGGSSLVGLGIYSAPVTAGGSLTLGYNSASASFITFGTDELTGADLTSTRALSPVGADTGSGSGSTAVDTGNLTSTGGGIFVGAMTYDGNAGDTTITQDGAFSLLYEYESWAIMTGSHILRIVTGATTDAASWTLGVARPWACCASFIKEAVGSSAPTLSAAGVQATTSTSAQPRVTLTF